MVLMEQRHEKELATAEEKRVEDLSNQAKEMNAEFELKTAERENEHQQEISSITQKAEEEYNKLNTEHKKLRETKQLLSAELHAVKGSKGLMDGEDFTSEESFEELEKELVAFYDMFVAKWKEAKKKMRNDVLWKRLKRARKIAEDKEEKKDI